MKTKDYTHDDNVRRCEEHNAGRMTMKDLRAFVSRNENLPDDTQVVIHRVEDVYFENHHWCVIDTLFEAHKYDDVMHNDFVNAIPAFTMYVTKTKKENKVVLITPHY